MPMFFCVWTDAGLDEDGDVAPPPASVLVDERTIERARKIATEHHGERPAIVRELPPGVFLSEVFFEEIPEGEEGDKDDEGEPLYSEAERASGDVVVYEPLEHVNAVLRLYADDALEMPAVGTLDKHLATVKLCGATADAADGSVVECAKPYGHAEEEHRGGGQKWIDE